MEKLLTKLTAELQKYIKEFERIDRIKVQTHIQYEREGVLRRLIAIHENWIAKYRRCLTKYPDDNSIKMAEEIASVCTHFANLDTPQKVLDHKKELYTKAEVKPLLGEIEKVKEKLEVELASFEQLVKAEEPIFRRFHDSFFNCLFDLAASPLVEQKTLTPNDTTHILEHLDPRHALVHTGRGENGDCSVFAIKTLDAPPRVSELEFTTRLGDIVTRTRKKYCRPRMEVEKELEAKKSASMQDEDLEEDEIDTNAGELDLVRFED